MDQRFEGQQRVALAVGLLRIEGRTVEFSEPFVFGETNNAVKLGLEVSEFH